MNKIKWFSNIEKVIEVYLIESKVPVQIAKKYAKSRSGEIMRYLSICWVWSFLSLANSEKDFSSQDIDFWKEILSSLWDFKARELAQATSHARIFLSSKPQSIEPTPLAQFGHTKQAWISTARQSDQPIVQKTNKPSNTIATYPITPEKNKNRWFWKLTKQISTRTSSIIDTIKNTFSSQEGNYSYA